MTIQNLLQQTMLDQIATVRSQLEEAKVRNLRLERITRPEHREAYTEATLESKYEVHKTHDNWRQEDSCKRWASETPVARG